MTDQPRDVVEVQVPALTDEQRRIQHLVHNLLSTLDAVVPASTIHYAVEGARRALAELDRKAGTVKTAPPRTWTFMGHWANDTIVVDYVVPGEVQDDRQDNTGAFPEGLWAAAGTGATVEEAQANALADYLDEEGRPYG
jgi:hypothetical protein